MRAILLASLLIAGSSFATPMVQRTFGDKPDFTPYIEEVPTPQDVIARFSANDDTPAPAEGAGVLIDEIINLGQTLWTIIEKNRPIQDIKYNYADALPKGASSFDLDNFSDLQFKSYRTWGKNGFGMNVFDVTYTLVHRYNGSFKSIGKYLENVTVLPHQVSTAWGYTTNLAVAGVSTVNVGTRENPIASLAMELNFKVSTVLKVVEMHNLYEFRGDSATVRTIDGK